MMKRIAQIGSFLLLGLLSELSAWAIDGVVLIDQNRALAGHVTPGDTPGFPITISRPGTYRLAGNLAVPDNADGIEITADHVTIDLNGFTISGANPERPTEGASAIFGSGSSDVSVTNGVVTGMDRGVFLANSMDAHIERIRAIGNRTVGILLAGYGSISNCIASRNGVGIEIKGVIDRTPVSAASSLRWNDTNSNSGAGIAASCPGTNLIGNTALGNGHPDVQFDGDRCHVSSDNFFSSTAPQ